MIIAIDFDGTIVEHRFPAIGTPYPMAFDVMKALKIEGHRLILWSNREGKSLEEAVEFCRANGVEFDAVNDEVFCLPEGLERPYSRKISADMYIDDKNIGGIPDWSEIYEIVMAKSNDNRKRKRRHHHRHHRHSMRHFIKNLTLVRFVRYLYKRSSEAKNLNF